MKKGDKHSKLAIARLRNANLGKRLSDVTKQRISDARKGWIFSEITKQRIRDAKRGKLHTAATKKKISDSLRGRAAWNKGKTLQPLSNETKLKIANAETGEKNYAWKGNDVSYNGLHKWVTRVLGRPDTCEHCGKTELANKHIHWANISGYYKRELTDWIRLCASCHQKYDKETIYH